MINYNDQPKLFSIIYGEGVFNDIVSIIMFNSVTAYFRPGNGSGNDWTTPFSIGGQFVKLGLYSILIGVVAGIVSTFVFKKCRMLTHSASTETILLLAIALIAYNASEAM
jgi:NhaP-type Na+/H+ or K+/H+ antiporter